ncbi:hypothetical protein QCD60_20850 [Pokkaliibacter sp. MBI-7]|uniref:hypothetical protein n=1 Tax=Pokkaliibacter sp. MBI-7 TaxID=3040600 RepID=UPI00244D2040|nr:hypothetical protein [Pokkaliibacter sp. MBI-7]MDH2434987.1 hypothetical protein [Pokkaliibacter sp. MBI-7]
MRFLNAICERWRLGLNRYGKPMPTLFHTSHPGLADALRRDPHWTQVSAKLNGEISTLAKRKSGRSLSAQHGGHFRAVQGFRYLGAPCES